MLLSYNVFAFCSRSRSLQCDIPTSEAPCGAWCTHPACICKCILLNPMLDSLLCSVTHISKQGLSCLSEKEASKSRRPSSSTVQSSAKPSSTPPGNGGGGGCRQKHWDQCGGNDWKGCTTCEVCYPPFFQLNMSIPRKLRVQWCLYWSSLHILVNQSRHHGIPSVFEKAFHSRRIYSIFSIFQRKILASILRFFDFTSTCCPITDKSLSIIDLAIQSLYRLPRSGWVHEFFCRYLFQYIHISERISRWIFLRDA